MSKSEKEFTKYKLRGDYHWQGLKHNIFKFNPFLEARYQMVLACLPKLKDNQKIIDIGCGDGALDNLIVKQKGGQIYGVDSCMEAIEIARDKFKKLKLDKCHFQTGNAYKLPFKDKTFDFAILADVIEHVGDIDRILKETRRVLKKGGKIVISSVIKISEKPEDKLHVKEYRMTELKNLLNKYFLKAEIFPSHPLFLKKLCQFSFKIGRYQPQPFRYLICLFRFIFCFNLFKLELGKFTCQTAIAQNDR